MASQCLALKQEKYQYNFNEKKNRKKEEKDEERKKNPAYTSLNEIKIALLKNCFSVY